MIVKRCRHVLFVALWEGQWVQLRLQGSGVGSAERMHHKDPCSRYLARVTAVSRQHQFFAKAHTQQRRKLFMPVRETQASGQGTSTPSHFHYRHDRNCSDASTRSWLEFLRRNRLFHAHTTQQSFPSFFLSSSRYLDVKKLVGGVCCSVTPLLPLGV